MSTPIIIGGPPPQKRVSTWVGVTTAAVGLAALNSPELTAAITDWAVGLAGDNAVGAALAVFGIQQATLAARRWLLAQRRRNKAK